jgi:hypothetical protein
VNASVVAGESYSIPIYRNGNTTNFRFSFESGYFTFVSSTVAPTARGTGYVNFTSSGGATLANTITLQAVKTGDTRVKIRALN